jgi:Tol biopolymer transport system component
MSTRPLVGAALALALGMAPRADAQYFGKTSVQWERLKFDVLKTEHFDIHYTPEEKEAAEQVGRLAERWYTRLSRVLGHRFKERQPVILYASQAQFQQTNTVGGAPGEGTGGVTEAFKRRIVLPVGASLAETDHVLGHELVHAFQYSMTGQGKISSTNVPSALRMPLWFIEGMAEYLSMGPEDAHTAMWIRDAARKEKLPNIRDLDKAKYFPYRYGQAVWAYLAGRFGDNVCGDALRSLGPRSNDAEAVLKTVTGVAEAQLSKDWHAAIRESVARTMEETQPPSRYAEALVTEKGQGGRLNVGPALSPDGRRIAFLSERDLFSVELFLADVKSGSIERRLSKTAVDTHLESIQFISSAGAWDRSGSRLALGAVSRGRPLLVILDAATGRRVKEVPFPALGEIATPSFAPDGQRVAFTALSNGFSDLFVYDLNSGTLDRLTHDAFADLQPAWSPDGRTIAFVTDRFTTRLEALAPGDYRLAAIDVASHEVRALPGFARGKNIDPQWSADGRSLFFLSDRTGITNVYRLEMEGGELRQLTDLLTGVSGITALSPALSVAAASDTLAFSVYDDGRHEIYRMQDPERLAGWLVTDDASVRAVDLIPAGKASGQVYAARRDAETGLPTGAGFETKPYKAKLGLDYVGQPYVAGSVGGYGTGISGGIAMSFSDMLGEHSLDTVFEASSVRGFSDVAGIASYVNRVHRLNWGVQVGQIPYVTGGFGTGLTTSNGQQVYAEQTYLERQMDRSVAGLGYYPFNSSFRIEGQAGFRRISFDSRIETDLFSLRTGERIDHIRQDLETADDINLYTGSLALVRDTSVFGATSPVMGQRFRLEVSPVGGSIHYVGTLADFRHYVMPVRPLTIAARIVHYGRYGSGGEDPRLSPLFLGYGDMVRGYDTGSFSAAECGASTTGSCPVYDQLLGSRLLVGNLEVRAPLLGLFGAKKLYGPIPVEIGAFFDAGVAWDSTTRPALFGGTRELVKSVGATSRVNLLGFAVLQVDYAKPLDRPGRKPFFQFNLLAGF